MADRLKAIRWCRVSSDEQKQEGYSLEEQDRMTREYCEREGLEVVKAFTNISESAWGKKPRSHFQNMVLFARKHKVDRIVVAKFDRCARNIPDFDAAWKVVLRPDGGSGLISITEPVPPGAAGRFTALMLACVAEFSSNQQSERIRDAMRAKARAGVPPGDVPYGYRHVRDGAGRDTVVAVEAEIQRVRVLYQEAATGKTTVDRLTARLQDLGGPCFARSYVHNMLTNEFYAGYFKWAGKTWKGAYPPAVSPNEFETAQRGIGRTEGKNRYGKHAHAYRGLLLCSNCQKPLTSGVQKGRIYNWCHRCKLSTIRQDRVAEACAQMLKSITVSDAAAKVMLRGIKDLAQKTRSDFSRLADPLRRKIAEIRQRLDAALDMHLDGRLDPETYERRRSQWEQEVAAKEAELAALGCSPEANLSTVAEIFKLTQRACELFVAQSDEEKRRFLDVVLLNAAWDGATLGPKWRRPFSILAERPSILAGSGGRI